MKNIRFHTIVVLFDRQLTPNVHFEISEVTWQFVFEWRQAFFENPKYPTVPSGISVLHDKLFQYPTLFQYPAPVIASLVTKIWIHATYLRTNFVRKSGLLHSSPSSCTDIRSRCSSRTIWMCGSNVYRTWTEIRSWSRRGTIWTCGNNVHVWHLHG